ncbi:hypothetical protein D9M69_558830 [compost metagenome]
MLDERIADLGSRPHHDAKHAGRKPSLLEHPGQQQTTGNGRVAGRLHYHRIAQRQGWRDRTLSQVQGEVPGTDHANHTHWSPIDAAFLVGNIRLDDSTMNSIRKRSSLQCNSLG